MGKMGLFTIHFANSSKIFYPGQDVQGEVQLQVKDEVKIRGKISSKLIQDIATPTVSLVKTMSILKGILL
jgi:hypothetical protein